MAVDLLASSFVFVPFALLRIEGKASALFSTYSLIRHAANTVLKVILMAQGYGVTGALISDVAASVLLAFCLFSNCESGRPLGLRLDTSSRGAAVRPAQGARTVCWCRP